MRHARVAVVLAVVAVLAAGCSHPRSGVEPLPDGLRIVAEHEPAALPIEGKRLCMVIAADDGADVGTVLDRLETHLTEEKGWRHYPSEHFIDWAALTMMLPGRAMIAGASSEFLAHLGPSEPCAPLGVEAASAPETVVLNIYRWEQ